MIRCRIGRSRDRTLTYLQVDGKGGSPEECLEYVQLVKKLGTTQGGRYFVEDTSVALDMGTRLVLGAYCPGRTTGRVPAGGWGAWCSAAEATAALSVHEGD